MMMAGMCVFSPEHSGHDADCITQISLEKSLDSLEEDMRAVRFRKGNSLAMTESINDAKRKTAKKRSAQRRQHDSSSIMFDRESFQWNSFEYQKNL